MKDMKREEWEVFTMKDMKGEEWEGSGIFIAV